MPKGYREFSTLSNQQSGLFDMLMQLLQGGGTGGQGLGQLNQQGMGFLQKLLSDTPEARQQFEAPYLRQFNEETIPGLAERFSGAGAGAQSSSAFQQQLGQAGAGLSERLASLRGGMQLQAANQPFENLLQLLQTGLGTQTKAFAPNVQRSSNPWLKSALGGAGGALGGGITGGPWGALAGGLGGLFGGR